MGTYGASARVRSAPGLVLRFDEDGTVVSVASTDRPDVRWLSQVGPALLTWADGPSSPRPPTVAVDADEIEVERTDGGLRTLLRHSVDTSWDLRLVLVNESDRELTLSDVRLAWQAGQGCAAVGVAGGSTARYAVQPLDGRGPVLVGRLRSGSQAAVEESGLVLGRLSLRPGHRWSASWRFEVVPDPRRAASTGDWPSTWLDLDQRVWLPAGPDVAVLAPRLGVEEHPEEGRVEVVAGEPGTTVVELRGARGTTAVELTWAPDLDDLVDQRAGALLDGPRTPGGTARLPDAGAGLVVQDALLRRTAGAIDGPAEALDLLAGSLLETAPDDPFGLAFLAREADRTGDASVLVRAAGALLAVDRPRRGLGIAGVALALSLVRAERNASAVVAHLAALRRDASGDAALELALLLGPGRDEPTDDGLARLRRLGAGLGAGLSGRLVPPAPVDQVAYAATLLALVDEPTGERLRDVWGVSAAEVARQAAAQARSRTAERGESAQSARALGWLVLGRPPR